VNLSVAPRDRLGIVGANGTGKSTLVDILVGRLEPTEGRREVGPTVVTGYYDQHGTELDRSARVQDLVAGPSRTPGTLADIELMKRFWFTGELPFARVGTLSGGELRRLQLLLVIAGRPNVLFLDEPTNDLDLDTLRIVEEFLEDWPGALVVVSHDRTFLERTTERLVAVSTDGSVRPVAGGVAGWIARADRGRSQRTATAPSASVAPTSPDGSGAPGSPATRRDRPPALGRLLRESEKDVARLQRQRDKITEALTVTTDHRELTRLGQELSVAQGALDAAEEQWLALAEQDEAGR
jgi:ATP-binding cassette subfamily F protein uup